MSLSTAAALVFDLLTIKRFGDGWMLRESLDYRRWLRLQEEDGDEACPFTGRDGVVECPVCNAMIDPAAMHPVRRAGKRQYMGNEI